MTLTPCFRRSWDTEIKLTPLVRQYSLSEKSIIIWHSCILQASLIVLWSASWICILPILVIGPPIYDWKVTKSFLWCVTCWLHPVSNTQRFSRSERGLAAIKCIDILPKLYILSLALEREGWEHFPFLLSCIARFFLLLAFFDSGCNTQQLFMEWSFFS